MQRSILNIIHEFEKLSLKKNEKFSQLSKNRVQSQGEFLETLIKDLICGTFDINHKDEKENIYLILVALITHQILLLKTLMLLKLKKLKVYTEIVLLLIVLILNQSYTLQIKIF